MRITTDFFITAYIRRRNDAGRFTAVLKRGDPQAGAIFIKLARLDGSADLYGPAPQLFVDADSVAAAGRLFEQLLERVPEAEADARLARERGFDPDCWLVETEDPSGEAGLDMTAPL